MGVRREPYAEEKKVSEIFQEVRNLDKVIWSRTCEKKSISSMDLHDIGEDIDCIKARLDELRSMLEVKYSNGSA